MAKPFGCDSLVCKLFSCVYAAFSHHNEGRPEHGVGVMGSLFILHQRQHGPAQRLGAADPGIVRGLLQHARGQLDRGTRDDRPVRHQQRPGTGVEERLGEARQGIGAGGAVGRRRVAGRKNDPVRVEPEQRDLAGGEQAIVLLGPGLRRPPALGLPAWPGKVR